MERYFKRKNVSNELSFVRETTNDDIGMDHSKKNRVEFNVDEFYPCDFYMKWNL